MMISHTHVFRGFSTRSRCGTLSAAFAGALFVGLQSAGADDQPPAKLAEGWSVKVPLSEADADGKTAECEVWWQNGWLLAERRSIEGDTEWMVVLAEAGDPTPPEIEADAKRGTLRLNYQKGRYFIRDEFGKFRCLRQRKTPEMEWPRLELPGLQPDLQSNHIGRGPWLAGRLWNGWYTAACEPLPDAFDCLVRLIPRDLSGPGVMGYETTAANINRLTIQGCSLTMMDDGDLLVGERLEAEIVPGLLALKKLRETLVGSQAPNISGTRWLNTEQPLTAEDLEDKVVLVAFLQSHEFTLIGQLGRLQPLYQRCGKDGLLVIGISDAGAGETFDDLVARQGAHFPIALDDGKTLKRFGNPACPSYFLIGRDGKLAWGSPGWNTDGDHVPEPPTNKQVEDLLRAREP